MSFEAITTISEAEENAKRSKAQALVDSRAAEAAAEAEGRASIAAAVKKAENELRESLDKADAEAISAAKQMADDTENKIAAMRASAEGRLDKAASLIVERIVNG
ncbi:MAG: hypothetical protein EOM54_07680 [Clostridia bacterium]|nr:hypothetical protein [Clostridia bacterium]NCC69093.1 hypothetical protein [Clostridia bacterium]